jgi:hypothetical protein
MIFLAAIRAFRFICLTAFCVLPGCGSSSVVALPRPQKHQNPESQDAASIPAVLGILKYIRLKV